MKSKSHKNLASARDEVEALLDEFFEGAESCHKIRDLAVWHLLTVFEDFCRFAIVGDGGFKFENYPMAVDENKYALKHSMDVIFKESNSSKVTLKQKILERGYEKSVELLQFGVRYQRLFRAISSSYNNRAIIVKSEKGYEILVDSNSCPSYTMLEVIGHGQRPILDFIVFAHAVLSGEENFSNIRENVLEVSKARLKNKLVVYKYNYDFAYYLCQKVEQRPRVIPSEFKFPWGSAFDTHLLINSLTIRCVYHLLVVDLLGRKRNVKGVNYESLVLKISKKQLVEDIGALCGDLLLSRIETFINFLTFGVATRQPDPALQPIFQTESKELLLPCSLIISNNSQRNILSLFARTNKVSFDQQSDIFENEMIKEATSWIDNYSHSLTNTTFICGGEKEEIDVFIVDPSSLFILILEFRWFLPPGDAREVQQKITESFRKVDQVDRKQKFVEKNYKKILKQYFKDVNVDDNWRISSCVVIKGFGGQDSPNECIPIIPLDALSIGAKRIHNLGKLYNWITSKGWLPVESIHFEQHIEEIDLDGVNVLWPCVESKTTPQNFIDHVESSAENQHSF